MCVLDQQEQTEKYSEEASVLGQQKYLISTQMFCYVLWHSSCQISVISLYTAMQSDKGKAHFPPPSLHHSLHPCRCTNPNLILTNHSWLISLQQALSLNMTTLKSCYFSLQSKSSRDQSLFLTGNWGRNQMSFLLRSAGVRRKETFYGPLSWLERAGPN